MSDKSYGDPANRNLVKNPLLSTAVTGLSLEDLTHNAVLLPVAASQELNIVQGQQNIGAHAHSFRHTDNPATNLPSGDANTNIIFSKPINPTPNLIPQHQQIQNPIQNVSLPQSKASQKTEDDFDVNEYFARLQGTRYVSAPLNSAIKDEANANLQAEDNLEEINLNEPEKSTDDFAQSLTADIAQNFSQLPTVLPQVASAVFSSFSNMLSMKSKENTPDEVRACQGVDSHRPPESVGVPFMVMSEERKEVPPPLMKPPTIGTGNYRITTKKKAYAQIPGLNSGETQPVPYNPPIQTNPPQYFVPNNKPAENQNPMTSISTAEAFNANKTYDNSANNTNILSPLSVIQNKAQNDEVISNIQPYSNRDAVEIGQNLDQSKPPTNMLITQPHIPIIPPPPMFSNLPRIDSQAAVVKSVLPPSVARRISANQPIIKSTLPPAKNIASNIFVPAPDTSTARSELPPACFTATNIPSTKMDLPPNSFITASVPQSTVNTISMVGSNVTVISNDTSQMPTKAIDSSLLASNFSGSSVAPNFTPATLTPKPQSGVTPTIPINPEPLPISIPMSSVPPMSVPYPPVPAAKEEKPSTTAFFNPISFQSVASNESIVTGPPMTIPPTDNVPEPPKVSGNLNYRLTKKRPQYYSGPIEGVGAISNNVKPTLNPVETGAYQGAMFTPGQQVNTIEQTAGPNFDKATVSFDISQPAQPYMPEYQQPTQQFGQYNTTFDLSRPADDYAPPEEESKGFGIIGSLKSKLSSIDINKIQNSVTMLFDPAYNDVKSSKEQSNISYEASPQSHCYGQNYPAQSYSENQGGNFEIFVPAPNTQQPTESFNYGYQNPYPVQDNPYKTQHQYDVYQNPATGQAYPAFSYYSAVSTDSTQAYTVAAGNVNVVPSTSVHEQVSTYYNPYNTDANTGNVFGAVQVDVNTQDTQSASKISVDTTEDNKEKETKDIQEETNNIFAKSKEIQQQSNSEAVIDHFASTSSNNKVISSPNQLEFSPVIQNPHSRIANETSENESKTNVMQFENFGALKDEYLSKFKDDMSTLANLIPNQTQFDSNIIVKSLDSNHNADDKKDTTKTDALFASFTNDSGEGLLKVTELTTSFPKEKQNSNNISDFNICETCREVNKPDDDDDDDQKEVDDVTSQMIENITSRIQLMNPVEVPLPEPNEVDDNPEFDSDQFAEISHVTEETIETLQKQAAAELLDDLGEKKTAFNYGWNTENINPAHELSHHDYSFQINPNNIGFYGTNSLFADNFPKNDHKRAVSDFGEVKPDSKVAQDKITSQMAIPSAPQIEDAKEEPGVLDVNSIELDAKEDYEEFVIEPSDDDKIESTNDKTDIVQGKDTFTNRVERFKMKEELDRDDDDVFDMQKLQNQVFELTASPAITIASYFDTGNFAVESHYRNSFTSPSSINSKIVAPIDNDPESSDGQIRIPPGFEEMFNSKFSGSQDLNQPDKNENVPKIPDTFTQTRASPTVTFSSANMDTNTTSTTVSFPKNTSTYSTDLTIQKVAEFGNVDYFNQEIQSEKGQQQPVPAEMVKLPDFASVFGARKEIETNKIETEKLDVTSDKAQKVPADLPDPINFFSSETKPSTSKEETAQDPNFNRLASYFSSPPKTDHAKSFFELSQSQNHYRHVLNTDENSATNLKTIPSDSYIDRLNLIKELASHKNIERAPEDQIVRTVNYFSVEYDNQIKPTIKEPGCAKLNEKGDVNSESKTEIDDKNFEEIVNTCNHCCNIGREITVGVVDLKQCTFKLRKHMDSDSSKGNQDRGNKMDNTGDENQRSVTVDFNNFSMQNDGHEDMTLMNEKRSTTEYEPVRHHWFYRVDFDGKSIWRGFSTVDSRNLEEAFNSPTLDENTLVQTDGGRFDVNIVGRLRIAVYWAEKPTNVRRCSWFYKGTTDARYVPYTEAVAEKLEEEYRRGMTTGEWHRRLSLPHQEMVVMHGPLVMVHFLQSGPDVGFSGPTLFTFGKRVYRNPPKLRLCKEQHPQIDHLLLVTHGAGEYRTKVEKDQSTARPRIVHRGCVEPEIEDSEPSSIDHLLLMCHGVGSACDLKMRPIEQVVDDFRATSSQLTQSHYKNSVDNGIVGRVEVLPISWHAELHGGERGVDARLQQVTLSSIPKLRAFTNDTVLDVLLYTSPVFCQTIINTVCSELNRIYNAFRARNPQYAGRVSLAGHSLGSLILYDLLRHQECVDAAQHVQGAAGTGQPCISYPKLQFCPDALYAMGSPIAIFECIRGVESLGDKFCLPTCPGVFNIFHPYDPIAYRIEPLINPQLKSVKPFLIPHHKGRKRMHLELKDTMARVGADIKQKVIESIKATWSSVWRAPPPSDAQLQQVVEEEMEKGQLVEEKEELEELQPSADMLGLLNRGRRVDYVLQEAPIEMINEYLFAMGSHVCYWESEDTMLLILREIYSSLGVRADGSVPQGSLSVPRARAQDDTYIVSPAEISPSTSPSTSRGSGGK